MIRKAIKIKYKGKEYASMGKFAEYLGIDISRISRAYHQYNGNLDNVKFNTQYKKVNNKYYYVINDNEFYTNKQKISKKYRICRKSLNKLIKKSIKTKINKKLYYNLGKMEVYNPFHPKIGDIITNKKVLEVLDNGKRYKTECLLCGKINILSKCTLQQLLRKSRSGCISCRKFGKTRSFIINGIKYDSMVIVDKTFGLCKGATEHYYRRHKGDMSKFNEYLQKPRIKRKVKSKNTIKKKKPIVKTKYNRLISEKKFIHLELEKNKSRPNKKSIDTIIKNYIKLSEKYKNKV